MKGFGESIAPTAAISAILGSYPFSCGLLREILQNSDDAKATKQVFLLDHRTHRQRKLIHEQLGQAQGPALLAFNNALFNDEDWVALRSIHQSSKKTDTSKIGKYGVGFRSCYHITDTPQILSGDSLAVLDPHQYYFSDGGQKINICENHDRFADQLAAFNLNAISPDFCPGTFFDGTIVRLPLRRDASLSEISTKVLIPSEIKDLLEEFAREEIGIAMLFLAHISTIEIMEVDERGTHLIARATVSREPVLATDAVFAQATCSVVVEYGTDSTQDVQNWVLTHAQFAEDDCAKELSRRLNRDAMPGLEREKLNAAVSLATTSPLEARTDGRLFTYLPLPLTTNFPTHVHALFALTQARQNLRNASERGIVPGTADELLIEWNRVLFEVYIPRTWAAHIELLATTLKFPQDIFGAWPPTSQESSGGDSAYWNNIAVDVLRCIALSDSAVWPLCENFSSSAAFGTISDVLIASKSDLSFVPALRAAGLKVCIVPPTIQRLLQKKCPEARLLTPDTAHDELKKHVEQIGVLSSSCKQSILEYLVSTSDPALVIGIPVIPLASGEYIALILPLSTDIQHVLLTDEETSLFSRFDPHCIRITSLPVFARQMFKESYEDVKPLLPSHVARYVAQAVAAEANYTSWTDTFWEWAAKWPRWTELFPLISDQPLLRTSSGAVSTIGMMIFEYPPQDEYVVQVLIKCDIKFLYPSFPFMAKTLLRQHSIIQSPYSLPVLLNFIDTIGSQLTEEDKHVLLTHVLACCSANRNQLSTARRQKLRSLPIFPLLTSEVGCTSRTLHCLPATGNVVTVSCSALNVLKIDGSVLLPSIDNTVFVSCHHGGIDLAPLLSQVDTTLAYPTSEASLLDMVIINLPRQRRSTQLAFLESFAKHHGTIAPNLFVKLRAVPFVRTSWAGIYLKSPQTVIDPFSALQDLFSQEERCLPYRDGEQDGIISLLSSLGALVSVCTHPILVGRLHRISSPLSRKRGPEPQEKIIPVES